MRPLLLVGAIALPLAALAAGIAVNGIAAARSSEWSIPVIGYDPRSPLRGQFIRFRYDWRIEGDPALCRAGACQLCLTGDPPDGSAVEVQRAGAPCRHAIDVAASKLDLVRTPGGADAGPPFSVRSRLFVSEASAPALSAQLAHGPMRLGARLTRGGRLINRRLEPLPATDVEEPAP